MKTTIETTWENLLETLSILRDEVSHSSHRDGVAIAASIHTLSLSLSGLGKAWHDIARQLPDETDKNTPGLTLQRAYARPLAAALLELGSVPPFAAIKRVGELMRDQLTDGDHQLLPKSRLVRWEVNVRFARNMLRERGLVNQPDGSSHWKLTQEGERWARAIRAPLPEIKDANQAMLSF